MKNKTMIAGVLVGLLGAGLLVVFVAQSGGAAEDQATTRAYVVTQTLEPGMSATEVAERVEASEVPERLAPERRVTDLADLDGQEVVRRVGTGEMLTADQFSPPGPAAGGVVVPKGYEAITVEAEPAPGVEGYVSPGSRVNVYATFDDDGTAEGEEAAPAVGAGAYTQLVLGHLDVLATAPASSGDEEAAADAQGGGMTDGKVVLLLQIRPEDAPALIHAGRQASLWYTLVNPDDQPPTPAQVRTGDLDPGARAAAINEARAQQDAAAASVDDTDGNADGEGQE